MRSWKGVSRFAVALINIRVQMVDRLTILVLIYTSFSDSVEQGIWSHYGSIVLVETIVGTGILFVIVLLLTRALSNLLGLSTEDRIAAVFCGSKKTLASGVPILPWVLSSCPS